MMRTKTEESQRWISSELICYMDNEPLENFFVFLTEVITEDICWWGTFMMGNIFLISYKSDYDEDLASIGQAH